MSTEIECHDYDDAKVLCTALNRHAKHVTAHIRSARNGHWAVVVEPKVES